MSDVTLSIGGRNYTVSCADGQEDHVRHLASVIDGKLSAMGNNLSSNDAKNLLFAALLVADELDEAKRAAEPPPEPIPGVPPIPVPEKPPPPPPALWLVC